MNERGELLRAMKAMNIITDYELKDCNAVAHTEKPISYMRIEITQKKCKCGCMDSPDNGACNKFEKGDNGRCVYCDHAKACHPEFFVRRNCIPDKDK
jgi:hypothetical protein